MIKKVKCIKYIFIVMFFGIFRTNIYSTEIFLNAKPLSMANAYTSISGDIFSLFYNPAGLATGRTFSLSTDFGASYNFSGGILYNANNILSLATKFSAIETAQKQGSGIDITQITALFDAIKNLDEISRLGKGILTSINGGLAINIKNIGFGVRNYTIIGAKPSIDTGFYLGTGTVTTGSLHKVLSFASENYSGITIPSNSTGTVNSELLQTQQELQSVVENFLKPTLENLGVEIPSGLTSEQIANALINIAVSNNISTNDIKDAVTKLKDPKLQDFIKNFLYSQNTKNIFSNNKSGLLFKGLNVTELNLSYAREIFVPKLYLGGSLRYLIGTSIYYNFLIFDETKKLELSDIVNLQNNTTKNSNTITFDLGAMYQLPMIPFKTQVGLVAKNLIEPEFELANTTEKLKLPRQLKFGCSTLLLKMFTLACDYDLLKTETFVPGYNIQNLSVGFEFNPPIFLSFRVGYLKNLVMEDEEMITGGLGIKIFAFNFDLTGVMNTKSINIDNTMLVPNNAALALSMRLDF